MLTGMTWVTSDAHPGLTEARALLHSVCDQSKAASGYARYDRLIDAISEKLPEVAAHRVARAGCWPAPAPPRA